MVKSQESVDGCTEVILSYDFRVAFPLSLLASYSLTFATFPRVSKPYSKSSTRSEDPENTPARLSGTQTHERSLGPGCWGGGVRQYELQQRTVLLKSYS